MNSKTIACVAATAAALALAGCSSSDDSSEATSSPAPTTTSAQTPTSTAAPAPSTPSQTISDYLAAEGITETPARPGDPGAPAIELPTPVGWEPATGLPGDPFWAIRLVQTSTPQNPPIIQATLSRLSEDVSLPTIFQYAPAELESLPGYQGMGDGTEGELGGLQAHQNAGMYDDDGVQSLVAQKTLVIQSQGGTYLLRVRANGAEADAQELVSATAELDNNTTITP